MPHAEAHSPREAPWRRLLARSLGVDVRDLEPLALAAPMFFLLFAGYFLLRPVRETMGIAGGVNNLQWLFTGTFVATLAAMPVFGWLASRVQRRRVLPWTLLFFAANLLLFAAGFLLRGDDVWLARGFYIWLSVFNLLAISAAWSVLADLFPISDAKRLFALMAVGASLGGLAGPLIGVALVGPFGHSGLLIVSAALLAGAVLAAQRLQRWRDRHPLESDAAQLRSQPLGGSPLAGFSTVLRSPFLLGCALFVVLLATVSTFLYFEQARLVAEAIPDRAAQTRLFGLVDAFVQACALLTQLFLSGRIAQRLGVGALLVAVPLAIAGGFVWLALAPGLGVVIAVMIARRVGEYALVRPGREMLFTVVPVEAKYKAKNFIDTVVYRGADAVGGWLKTLIALASQNPAVAALVGAGIALGWAGTGWWLARAQRSMAGPEAGADSQAFMSAQRLAMCPNTHKASAETRPTSAKGIHT